MEGKIIDLAVKEIADRIWNKIENQVDEVILLTPNRVAGMAEITVTHLKRCIEEVVDFGDKTDRISLAQFKRFIAKRTVKKNARA